MKTLCMFLSLSCFVYGGPIDMQDLHDKARLMTKEYSEGQDEDDILFEVYSQAIEEADEKSLQETPELVFCRARVWPDLDTPDDRMHTASMMRKDFLFVLNYAAPDSRLFKAAKEMDELVALVMEGPYETDEDILQEIRAFNEGRLKRWATDTSLSDLALRVNVLENLQNSPEALNSFVEHVFLMDEQIEVVLGSIQPEVLQIALVYEDASWYLMCEYTYVSLDNEHGTITITMKSYL